MSSVFGACSSKRKNRPVSQMASRFIDIGRGSSINNVVDVTNYVLMEIGHPLHAFDYDMLAGHKIVVKTAKENEKFITLDGKERILGSETLMICDAERQLQLRE